MIEGLKVDLTGEELRRLLEQRIKHHKEVAADCDQRQFRLRAVTTPNPEDTEEQLAAAWPPYVEHLDRRGERHRDRAEAMQFLHDHLISHEIYRVGQEELELLQLWPQDTAVRGLTEGHE